MAPRCCCPEWLVSNPLVSSACECRLLLPDGVLAQGVEVRVNGNHVGKWVIDRGSTWSVSAAASLFEAGKATHIELLISHPTCGPNAHDRWEFDIKVSTIVIEKKAIAEEPRPP